jgi:hypothetical protein
MGRVGAFHINEIDCPKAKHMKCVSKFPMLATTATTAHEKKQKSLELTCWVVYENAA